MNWAQTGRIRIGYVWGIFARWELEERRVAVQRTTMGYRPVQYFGRTRWRRATNAERVLWRLLQREGGR